MSIKLPELTPEQEARAREIVEDCRQMPRWAARQIIGLQDRLADLERISIDENGIHVACGAAGQDAKQFSGRDVQMLTAIALMLHKKHQDKKHQGAS